MNQYSAGPTQPGSSEALFPGFPTLDITRLLSVVKRRIWLAGLIAGVFVALAVAYVMVATKIYKASAVIYVDPKNESAAFSGIKGTTQASWETLDSLKSMAEGIRSGTVILRVVERLDLKNDPDFLKPRNGGYSDAEIVEIIGKRVEAELIRGTRTIEINVKDKSPVRAQEMAQAFIDEFQELILDQNADNSRKTRGLLEKQAEEQLKRVSEAEDKLQAFREDHADIPLEEEGGVEATKLGDLESLLSRAAIQVIERRAEYEQLQEIEDKSSEAVLDIGSYRESDSIQKLLLARNQKKAEFYRIQQQFEPTHQTYQAFKGDLDGLDLQVAEVAKNVAGTIEKAYQRAVTEEEKLSAKVTEQKQRLLSVDDVRKEFRALKRSVDATYTTYQRLLDRINDTDVAEGVDETVVRVFSPPLVPTKPVSPKKKVTVAIAGVFGSMVGVAVVIGIGLLDRRLHTRKQVESTLGLSVLAEIPRAFDKKWDLKDSLFVTKDPNSLVSEGFRALRSSLSAHSPRSVMITSATPGEGKSFCAANLALLQAHFGYRTLLVDADFRKPRMAEIFTDPLHGEVSETALVSQNLCQQTVYKNLFLLSCGRFTANTGEPMNGEVFASMLWEAYSSFDCVIIDTSPLAVVSDGLAYVRHVDAVAVVIEAGKTQTHSAQRVISELRRMRANLVGCILNGVTDTNPHQKAYMQSAVPQKPVSALPSATSVPPSAAASL